MAVYFWSDRLKTWKTDDCSEIRPFEFSSDTDLVTVPRSATPQLIVAWSGPVTDRARIEVRQVQSEDYPVTMRFVLGTSMSDVGEEWQRLVGSFTLNNSQEGQYGRPLGVTGGVPTRRWTLRAALDNVGAVKEVQCRFTVFLDRGMGSSVPYALLATGVT